MRGLSLEAYKKGLRIVVIAYVVIILCMILSILGALPAWKVLLTEGVITMIVSLVCFLLTKCVHPVYRIRKFKVVTAIGALYCVIALAFFWENIPEGLRGFLAILIALSGVMLVAKTIWSKSIQATTTDDLI